MKILKFIWTKIDGKKTIIFNSLAAYFQYLVAEDVIEETTFMKWIIKSLLFAGMLSLGHKAKKSINKSKN